VVTCLSFDFPSGRVCELIKKPFPPGVRRALVNVVRLETGLEVRERECVCERECV